MKIVVTGGAGFIGSALIRYLIKNTDYTIINIDKLTYAGNLDSLLEIRHSTRYFFEKMDICNKDKLEELFLKYSPDSVIHLAAESHVDKSIEGPQSFIDTNIIGTFNLLSVSLDYWNSLKSNKKQNFKFQHISTDEVYGDLNVHEKPFTENHPYKPSSPYAASKASSDHLVKAWHRTFNLPILITNCSNNYGPFHYPEKLIPLTIINAINQKNINVYGNGKQIRDWIYVDDHVEALTMVFKKGNIGETYNIGASNEYTNLDVVKMICEEFNNIRENSLKKNFNFSLSVKDYNNLICFVKDRPGHDFRYAINANKIKKELGWKPKETFSTGLKKTIWWFIENIDWWKK